MAPQYIDIHSHVHFPAFDEDREEVIARARDAGVAMIQVGTQKDTSRSALELARAHERMYATVGLHPIHAGGASYHDANELNRAEHEEMEREFDEKFFTELARDEKVVAIGECGLDYYRLEQDTKEKQKEAFRAQIRLANTLGKPLMLHVRGPRGDDTPYEEALRMLKEEAKVGANFHFYAGSLPVARKIWDAGYTTSFTGVITFTNAYDEVVREAPQSQIMTETDCPYVAPVPYRGKRNEPAHVAEVARRIAELKGITAGEAAEQAAANAARFFAIPSSSTKP